MQAPFQRKGCPWCSESQATTKQTGLASANSGRSDRGLRGRKGALANRHDRRPQTVAKEEKQINYTKLMNFPRIDDQNIERASCLMHEVHAADWVLTRGRGDADAFHQATPLPRLRHDRSTVPSTCESETLLRRAARPEPTYKAHACACASNP